MAEKSKIIRNMAEADIAASYPLLSIFFSDFASLEPDPLCQEIVAWNARNYSGLWDAARRLDPKAAVPYWGIVWPGGRALGRYVLDNTGSFKGRRVLDIGSGSGLSSVAAAMAGADVTGMDIEPIATELAAMTAEKNRVRCRFITGDTLNMQEDELLRYDIVMAGDIFNNETFAQGAIRLLRRAAGRGMRTYASDGGHTYRPSDGTCIICSMRVPLYKEIEGINSRDVEIFSMKSEA